VVVGGAVKHHHSRNSVLASGEWGGGWGGFGAEARSRKPKDHKNGSMDSKAAWYDDLRYINQRNGSTKLEFDALLPKEDH